MHAAHVQPSRERGKTGTTGYCKTAVQPPMRAPTRTLMLVRCLHLCVTRDNDVQRERGREDRRADVEGEQHRGQRHQHSKACMAACRSVHHEARRVRVLPYSARPGLVASWLYPMLCYLLGDTEWHVRASRLPAAHGSMSHV